MPLLRQFDSRRLSLTAALSGVYVVFRLVPISRFIGLPGALTASGMVIPIVGVMLEPQYGVLVVLIGTFLGFFAPWNPVRFGGLDFLPGAINLLVVSLAIRGRRTQAGLVFLGVLVLFILTPFTKMFVGTDLLSPPVPYFWLHLIALLVLFSPLSRKLDARLNSENYRTIGIVVLIVAFAGTMVEHLMGGILFAMFLGSGSVIFWRGIYLVYPIERAITVIGAVLVCPPLLKDLKSLRERLSSERSSLLLSSNVTSD